MRANEFVIETRRGKVLDAHAKVSPGAAFTLDGWTDLYRASMLMARCPADADDIDPYSYVTNRPMIVTYTDEEKKMVKQAFKRMGIEYHEHTPSHSEEPDAINNVSPIVSFTGY
jgi:hypothetical protein